MATDKTQAELSNEPKTSTTPNDGADAAAQAEADRQAAEAKAEEDRVKAQENSDAKSSSKSAKFGVGDDVTYPYEEADSGRRVGEVLAVDGEVATVRYADGGERNFSVDLLKKVK